MAHVALSAIGSDRPGIVAAVTGALVDLGCNLEDTSMSILRGHFAMMLVVAVPDGVTAADVDTAVSVATSDFDLVVVARPMDDDVPASPSGRPWTITVYGADRPGIVYRVASLLAADGVNIVDVTTRVIGEPDRPVYAMFLDVTVPLGVDGADLTARLTALANELGVSCSARATEPDVL